MSGITILAAGLFLLLRFDIALMLSHRAEDIYRVHYASPRLIEAYLRDHTDRRLQIGSGPNTKAGWLNTDIEPQQGQAYLDASKPFPLPDRSFRYIFSEHVIEHVNYAEGQLMLRECYRILTPGGRVRIATPDLRRFVALLQPDKDRAALDYIAGKSRWHGLPLTPDPEAYILNVQMREWGHQFLYTSKLLRANLEAAGFRQIVEFSPGDSDDQQLKGIEARAHGDIREYDRYETMVFQAVRE